MGLFLVPLGELEEWLVNEKIAVSKTNKWAWANAAAQRILQLGKQKGDIWDFVSTVGRYLTLPAPSGMLLNGPLNPTGADAPPADAK